MAGESSSFIILVLEQYGDEQVRPLECLLINTSSRSNICMQAAPSVVCIAHRISDVFQVARDVVLVITPQENVPFPRFYPKINGVPERTLDDPKHYIVTFRLCWVSWHWL
jgi:hypothetical protein